MRVRKALADVDRVVGAFLEIASNDKIKDNRRPSRSYRPKRNLCFNGSQSHRTRQDHFKPARIHALKDAWNIEKRNLTTRIAELDTEAKEARKLKTQIVETEKALAGKEKDLAELQGKITLAEQQHNNDVSTINTLKQQITEHKALLQSTQGEHKDFIVSLKAEHKEITTENKQSLSELQKELKQVRADLTTAQDALNSEKLTNAQKELQLEKDFATEKEEILKLFNLDKPQKHLFNFFYKH